MKAYEMYGHLMRNMHGNIVGYDEVIEDMLICLSSGGHLLLEGVPGVAKTTLAKTFSDGIGLSFKRIQFTQDLLPSDITGHYFYNQKQQEFQFRKGPIHANIVLADEINRAPSKTQSALLEAMEERQVTVEGTTYELDEPFMVIATINPIEHEGVYNLPEAQLDRFMIKSKMDYLPQNMELDMLARKNDKWKDRSGMEPIKGLYQLLNKEVRTCHADENILTYIRDIIVESRKEENVMLGASPRAGELLLYASKAKAMLSGRSHVIPDDVKSMSRKVLPHRIMLNLDSELDGLSPSLVVDRILNRVPILRRPRPDPAKASGRA
ncbi:MAG: MoxR family ATPase [Candidatus Thermoplasmatota archaeon]|nr:MoxR family ATPase [Candidatus Thermoplasmatota archaeon]